MNRVVRRHGRLRRATVGLGAPWILVLLAILGCGGAPKMGPPGSTPQPAADEPATPREERPEVAAPPTGREAEAPPTEPEEEAAAAPMGVLLDTIRAGRFDNGKMWTFEFPPVDYLEETYRFTPDEEWFERARLGALRIPNCSASFVSPNGLVMTNHHCARESVSKVSREGENLLDAGFYAGGLEEERPIEDFHADRLMEIVDVTEEVYAALEGKSGEARQEARDAKLEEIQTRISEERGGEEEGVFVEMISLYNGARFSAYIFHRYTDVRLVMAPELQIGFFGGDPDNFTYPRYNLDVSFLRVYGEDGEPLKSDPHFTWSEEGVREGDLIFVIGNPGSTSRLQTVAELEFRREVSDRLLLDFVRSRAGVLADFIESHPAESERLDLRNKLFSLLNTQKATTGMLEGLNDPVLMARREDAEKKFRDAIQSDSALQKEYGGLIDRMAELQGRKREVAPAYGTFLALDNTDFASSTLFRALMAFQVIGLRQQGSPPGVISELTEGFLGIGDKPRELEEALIAARIRDFVDAFGARHALVTALLQGRSVEEAATAILSNSALVDSAGAAAAINNGSLSMSDPAIQVVFAYVPYIQGFQQLLSEVTPEEEEIAATLGRARFQIHGIEVPPDATFSLRVADGVVSGYEYNGTVAPAYTTFHGLYDRFSSFGDEGDWALPARWLSPPASFERSTALNFVSTADIIGGNSGSPVLNRRLEVVGLVFDGNIESLTGDYIYLSTRSRAVAVDARGILEALDDIYDADRIVLELISGRLAPTEAEADRIRARR